MVAVWPAHVAADPTGVPWDRCETGDAGESARGPEGVHVPAGASDGLRPQQRARARHAEDHLGIPVLSQTARDPCIHGCDLFVQSQNGPGQGVHHGGRCALPGHGGMLSLRCSYGRLGHRLGATHFAVLRPGREPARADPAQAGRGRIAGQQHECSLGRGVIEGPLQGREVLQQLCPSD